MVCHHYGGPCSQGSHVCGADVIGDTPPLLFLSWTWSRTDWATSAADAGGVGCLLCCLCHAIAALLATWSPSCVLGKCYKYYPTILMHAFFLC